MTEQAAGDAAGETAEETAGETAGPPVAVDDEAPPAPQPPRRTSRWDRPPPPKDWRYVVGTLGKVLIVTGLLMFGFVAYQLWGTGIETARAQNRLEDRFQELLASDEPAATTPETVPPETVPPETVPPETVPSTTAPPVPEPLPVGHGEVLFRLEIPRIGKELYVVPGVGAEDLKKGPGHYPDTPLPGQLGNAAIAGHRTTWGEPFAHVDELEPGDEIVVTMPTGDRFVYAVTDTLIVEPSDYWVVATDDPSVATLTLTSCHPRYQARQRIVVQSVLVPDESAAVTPPTYYSLDGDAGDAGDAGDGDPAIVEPPADTADTAGTAGSPAVVAAERAAPVEDPFAGGWFHDRGAFAQIALWAAVLIAISLAAYAISRRFRHYAVGVTLAAAPFVVALYFFYQNVNRLLPPGL